MVGAPERNFLSAEMEAFLADSLAESVASGRRWRVIGNQSIIAKIISPQLTDPMFAKMREREEGFNLSLLADRTELGRLGLTDDLDSWSGYPAARERFYQTANQAGASDLIVISGDSHSYWPNTLSDNSGRNMGVELGSTGITSPSSLLSLGTEGAAAFDALNQAQNPAIVWTSSRYRGFIKLQLNHQGAQADYIAVDNIESRDYSARIVHRERIANSEGQLRFL